MSREVILGDSDADTTYQAASHNFEGDALAFNGDPVATQGDIPANHLAANWVRFTGFGSIQRAYSTEAPGAINGDITVTRTALGVYEVMMPHGGSNGVCQVSLGETFPGWLAYEPITGGYRIRAFNIAASAYDPTTITVLEVSSV